MNQTTLTTPAADLTVERVRHTLKLRQLTVQRVQSLTPHMVRVTLTGEDLADFVSASFDDHVKLFLPEPGQAAVLPTMSEQGLAFPADAPKPVMRDYTPRRYDAARRELDIDFVVHASGPATSWAAQARAGDTLAIGGPRGSFVVPTGFDWHLLVGDDSALPAIARRLEELPATTQAIAVIEVIDARGVLALASRAATRIVWLHRDGAARSGLADAVAGLTLPPGEGYAWAAAESTAARDVRRVLVEQHGMDKKRVRASSYWKQGAVGVHETHED
ncbi:siderophore-interacting protein [Bordetella genomosp. 5]|uniref:NADPH-dependent ferric siderophore reductase n=1 Tax=Bordetella genomosp. 5 TaxID=1395608 RepID=A0A261TQ63_9BORD|nr:siderophore-interacting protein [Bordetella genomosp. 5]OZI51794.1 NADPH-dependent ferric siderophore reductase [Bordetella genomosp. 5]